MRTPTIFIVLTAMILVAAPARAATINLNPGDSIQAAINSASGGDEVVLAAGTYIESIDFLGKAITLRGASGDPADTTIDGNGAIHVVQCVTGEGAGTVLEGVTVTGGNADGLSANRWGGGMYNNGSSPTVTNCSFVANSAGSRGGGMCNNGSNPSVTSCIFSGNSTSSGDGGGGMYNFNRSAPVLTNCTFSGNSAMGIAGFRMGGGMANSNSSPTVTKCAFTGNAADNAGGGMANADSSNPTITDCTFSGNSAGSWGGAMDNHGSSSPMVTNSTFSGNTGGWGGAMAIRNSYYRGANVINCTFSGNTAIVAGSGGALFTEAAYSIITLSNCILWGNSPNEITSAYLVVASCNVEGGHAGLGNIDADPLFVNAVGADSISGTADDDLRLTAGSPCIDSGDDAAVPAGVITDADSNDRFQDGDGDGTATVDMGAYELATPPCVGDTDGNGVVDVDDLISVILDWDTDGSANSSDVNASGVVDCDDLVAVILAWGICP